MRLTKADKAATNHIETETAEIEAMTSGIAAQRKADLAALKHLDPVEPDMVRQTSAELTDIEQGEWFTRTGAEFHRAGAKHVRYSIDPERGLRLTEGWNAVPANEGEPRWQVVED